MEKIKKFLKKLINRETILYVVFGVLTTLVSIGTFTLFNYIFAKTGLSGAMTINGVLGKIIDKFNGNKDLSYLLSNTISWIFAVAFAFVTNKLFVFESKSWKFKIAGKELIAFVGARLFSLLLETLFIFVFVTLLGWNKLISKLIVQVIVVVLNYIFSKLLVFRKKDN